MKALPDLTYTQVYVNLHWSPIVLRRHLISTTDSQLLASVEVRLTNTNDHNLRGVETFSGEATQTRVIFAFLLNEDKPIGKVCRPYNSIFPLARVLLTQKFNRNSKRSQSCLP